MSNYLVRIWTHCHAFDGYPERTVSFEADGEEQADACFRELMRGVAQNEVAFLYPNGTPGTRSIASADGQAELEVAR